MTTVTDTGPVPPSGAEREHTSALALDQLGLPVLELAGDPPRPTFANRAAVTAFGRLLTGTDDDNDWAGRLLARDGAAFFNCAADVLRDGAPRTLAHLCRTPDGGSRRLSTLFQAGRVQDGRASTVLALMMEVPSEPDELERTPGSVRALGREPPDHERSTRRLAIQQMAARVLVESATVAEAISEILRALSQMLDCPLVVYWAPDRAARVLRCEELWVDDALARHDMVEVTRAATLAPGEDLPGQAWAQREPIWMDDLAGGGEGGRGRAASAAGLRTAASFPLCAGDEALGVIEIFARDSRPPEEEVLHLMAGIGHQICQALRRADAQRALAESEAHKATVIAAALDGVVGIDENGRIVEMNPAAERIFGRRGGDLFGRRVADLFLQPPMGPDGAAPAPGAFAGTALVVGERLETWACRANGAEFPVEATLVRTNDDPSRFTLYVHDLSGQAAALEAVRKSRDELGMILHAIPAGITVQDSLGAIIFANDVAAATCGFPTGEAMLQADRDEILSRFEIWDEAGNRLGPQDLPGAHALAGRSSERLLRLRPMGAVEGDRWLSLGAIPARDAGGRVIRVINVFHDVTERRRAERWQRFLGEVSAALASTMDPALLAQGIADLAVRLVAEWCAVDMSQPDRTVRRVAAAHVDPGRLDTLEEAKARAPRMGDVRPFSQAVWREGRGQLFAGAAEILAAAAPDAEQAAALRALGVESLISVPLGARGEVIGAITLATTGRLPRFGPSDLVAAEDMARRISITIDNIRLYGEAQEALRAREDLLAIVSHDLRNPLGVVLASSALLLKSSLPPEKEERARRQVEAIQRAGNRMNRLIRDLLDFASIQGGRLSITLRTHDPHNLVGEVLDVLEPLAAQKSQRLANELVGHEGELEVSCDHDRLIQALSNMVGNAIKFTPDGGGIRVGAAREGDWVRFHVADNGPGIPTDEVEHVFDRYFQARRKNRDGIGLGLSIAKGIVDAHGGRIWVESQEGGGSTFYFTLPAAPPIGSAGPGRASSAPDPRD